MAEKFLERDELASMSFQNDFLTPFVVVMRQSGAKEIRELIIRQASRMVLSRVTNIKSGWKSMFMVRFLSRDSLLHTVFLTSGLMEPGAVICLDCRMAHKRFTQGPTVLFWPAIQDQVVRVYAWLHLYCYVA